MNMLLLFLKLIVFLLNKKTRKHNNYCIFKQFKYSKLLFFYFLIFKQISTVTVDFFIITVYNKRQKLWKESKML